MGKVERDRMLSSSRTINYNELVRIIQEEAPRWFHGWRFERDCRASQPVEKKETGGSSN